MSTGFSACSGCGRHVRRSESACPFCQTTRQAAPLADARGARGGSSGRELLGARASRAALFAGAVLVAGCGGGDDDGGDGDGGGGGTAQPATDAGGGGGVDGGVARDEAGVPIAQPVYGAPVHAIDGG